MTIIIIDEVPSFLKDKETKVEDNKVHQKLSTFVKSKKSLMNVVDHSIQIFPPCHEVQDVLDEHESMSENSGNEKNSKSRSESPAKNLDANESIQPHSDEDYVINLNQLQCTPSDNIPKIIDKP